MGFPANRPRVYTLMYRKDRFNFSGSGAEFETIMGSLWPGQDVNAAIFFQDPSRYAVINVGDLPTAKRDAVGGYQAVMCAKARKNQPLSFSVADLEQRSPYGSVSDVMPTLVTHGTLAHIKPAQTVFEGNTVDVLCAEGHLDVMLFPSWSLARRTGNSDAWVKAVSGNSMHQLSVGPLLMYILGHLRRIDARLPLQMPQLHSDHVAELSALQSQSSQGCVDGGTLAPSSTSTPTSTPPRKFRRMAGHIARQTDDVCCKDRALKPAEGAAMSAGIANSTAESVQIALEDSQATSAGEGSQECLAVDYF